MGGGDEEAAMSVTTARTDGLLTWLGLPAGPVGQSPGRPVPPEELRFAVVLNGGVSLAVWMGGATLELDRLTRARRDGEDESPHGKDPADPYALMLRLAGCTARADVISGTSAGGINGSALALAQVNDAADLTQLRDLWTDQGRFETLLREPFRGQPPSLLRGDDYFLPALNDALSRLAVMAGPPRDTDDAPLDLSITTTVLRGNQTVTVDSMGQLLPQTVHAARFRFQRLPNRPVDPFSSGAIVRTAHRLALASRCTASFPVAFEPVFVPVAAPTHVEPAGGHLDEEQRLRPDMDGVVDDWGDDAAGTDRSRFVVDGGLLANTPTRPALEGIERMPAEGPVRRVLLLVYPHAGEPRDERPETPQVQPTLVQTVGGLLGALSAQGSRTFVEEVEQHNKLAAGRRGTRADILREVTHPSSAATTTSPASSLEELCRTVYPHYCRLRRWRAARDLAAWAVQSPEPVTDGRWNYERIRREAEQAQEGWVDENRTPRLPYVPDDPPSAMQQDSGPGWAWGVTTGVGIASSVADLLRRLVWVLPAGSDLERVKAARRTVSELTTTIRGLRSLTDGIWATDPVLVRLEPTEQYWRLRLGSYHRLMNAEIDADDWDGCVEAVVDAERQRPRPIPDQDIRDAFDMVRTMPAVVAGQQVRAEVMKVVGQLAAALPVLEMHLQTPRPAVPDAERELRCWFAFLTDAGAMPVRSRASQRTAGYRSALLTRLLQLEVASTALGDEATTGAELPVELVQLSAQAQNPFTQYTKSGDDKLGGWSLNRFGGFVKRSWRVNDWTWGRLDAASVLARTVLQPDRVRRAAALSGYLDDAGSAGDRARATVDELMPLLFGASPADQEPFTNLRNRAVEELTAVLGAPGTAGLPASLPAVADLFAWALHLRTIAHELPALEAAIRADGIDGANKRSQGEIFLAEHGELVRRLSASARGDTPADAGRGADRRAALAAFDRAGIGREPWGEEAGSDLAIRTATTTAAVAASVLDAERSGLGPAKPVTRLLRGVTLLPYWVVKGLTSRAGLPRALALLALSTGASLLALSLFGVLPTNLSGPAAALGVGALLVAFAYGAARTRTMLHGLVLLTPLLALLAFAARSVGDGTSVVTGEAQVVTRPEVSADRGLGTLAVVLALSLALMLLASLPSPTGSVWAALDRLAVGQRVPAQAPPPLGWLGRQARRRARTAELIPPTRTWYRRAEGLARAVAEVVPAVLVAGIVVVVVVLVVRADELPGAAAARENTWVVVVVSVALVALGALTAGRRGRSLQLLRSSGSGAGTTWSFNPVAEPGGAAAGWAVLYGVVYLVAAIVLLQDPSGVLDLEWGRALLLTVALLGVVLAVVAPFWLPRHALSRVETDEVARATRQELRAESVESSSAFAEYLVGRSRGFRALVTPPADGGTALALTGRGETLLADVVAARNAAGPDGPAG